MKQTLENQVKYYRNAFYTSLAIIIGLLLFFIAWDSVHAKETRDLQFYQEYYLSQQG